MFLGIDIGTSAVKAVIVDERGVVASQGTAPLAVERPKPLWSEQSPDEWWRATCEAVLSLPGAHRAAVAAIGPSGQMHGATLLDSADRPLRPAILWNDGRAGEECALLEQAEPRLRSIAGNAAMPGFTAPKLLWVRRHEPELFRACRSVLLPKDYVRLLMTGEKVSDMSDAAGTLWLDVAKRDWSLPLLEATGLDLSQMPRLIEGSALSGRLRSNAASALGLPSDIAVAGGGGDNAASAVGMGAVEPGDAFLSIGTSGVVFICDDAFLPRPSGGVHAFCHALPSRWHRMSVMLSAGSAISWAAAAAGYSGVRDAVAAAEALGDLGSTPVFLPYLSGERTPHNDPLATGVLYGMSHDTTPAHIVQAALEGVAFGLADGVAALSKSAPSPARLSVVGGGARLDYWGRILASALGVPLAYRQASEVGAALGAARLGMLATGGRVAEACPAPAIEREIDPDPGLRSRMSERQETFRRLYPALQMEFKRRGQ